MTDVAVVLACGPGERDALVAALSHAPGLRLAQVVEQPARLPSALSALPVGVLLVDAGVAGGAAGVVRSVMSAAPLPILVLAESPSAREADALLAAGAVEVRDRTALSGLAERCRVLAGVAVVRRPVRVEPERLLPLPVERSVLAVAASTGGPPALARLLAGLAELAVPVLVVQHIAADFLPTLAGMLSESGTRPVSVVADGDHARPGHVHLAPGGRHLRLLPGGRLSLSPQPAGLHVPSADVLFSSVATCTDVHGIGVLLTGMGRDGAQGLLALREAGGRTLVQDEASSTVYGMPRAALELGAAEQVVPLDGMADAVRRLLRGAR